MSFSRQNYLVLIVLFLLVVFVCSVGIDVASRHFGLASATAPVSSHTSATEIVEETVTLSPSEVKISSHSYEWYPALPYCGPPFHIFPPLDDVPGSVVAGYEHYYDKGAKVFGCPDGAQVVFRGSVWFDLSDIVSKAPPLHVFVKSASLHFKKDRNCPGEEMLLGNSSWMKGWPDGTLVPGDPFIRLSEADDLSSPVDIDVTSVLNNWVKGEEHGGYLNYGFVFKGPVENDLKYTDNNVCIARYSDLSLTVAYKYDKTPTVLYVPPERPTILVSPAVTRVNVASAASGATATAQDYTRDDVSTGAHFQPQYAIDGVLHIRPPVGDLYWRDEHGLPTWLQIDFTKSRKIGEIDVFTVADDADYYTDPTTSTKFTKYGTTAFDVQYWNGSSWVTVPDGSITGNNLVWRKITFPAITTSKIRVTVNAATDKVARIAEVQAF